MSDNTYEYECMRAELLGIGKPDYDEFVKNQVETEKHEVEEEEIDLENMKVRKYFLIQNVFIIYGKLTLILSLKMEMYIPKVLNYYNF